MRLIFSLPCVLVIASTSACSPKPEPVALHHAAVSLQVLLENGYTPDTLAHAISDLHVETEVVRSSLSNDASKKCDHAASASDSLRHIYDALVDYEKDNLDTLRPQFENIGLVKNDHDWSGIQEALEYGIPADPDTDAMASLRSQMRDNNVKTIFDPARNMTLEAVKDCERAT